MAAPLHTYIHALVDVLKRPDLPMALPKSTLVPTNIVGNDAVKALLFYQRIIAELFPGKVNVTVFAFESTIPVIPDLLAPCKESTVIVSSYCLDTRSNVVDVVLIVPNTIAVSYFCKSILIDLSNIFFLFTLLFHL